MGKVIAVNRRARRDFSLLESYEAGIVLQGTEVKSLRTGRASLQDSFASIDSGEVFLYNMHISPYECGNRFNHDPKRTRKLLLHCVEIKRLMGRMSGRGLTLVPLRLYFKRGRAKVEISLARGKREYDKREDIRKREAQIEVQRALRPRAAHGR
jgi:SsrA-binding protein